MKKFSLLIFRSFLLITLFVLNSTLAQKPRQNQALVINPDVIGESSVRNNIRFDVKTGIPVALYNPNYLVRNASQKEIPEQYLSENSQL